LEARVLSAIIFDMDGTLSDPTHRRHHVTGPGKKNWAAWNATMGDDPPNAPIVALARLFHGADAKIVVCTGRHEEYRRVTETWLLMHDVPVHRLYMRPSKDSRPDHVVKLELLAQIRADGFDPHIVVDDRASVVAMWREAGLTCLQCAPGDF
jgi:phosphoglycolate phosphatase-like HAD superfamily hydrolase